MTELVIWLAALLLIALGLAGLVFPALPGPILLFAGLWMAAWAEGFVFVGLYSLITLGVLAGLATLADFVAGAFGARRSGASGRSVWGATIGAVIGVFFGLPGLVLGPFIGAVIGELSVQWNLAAAGRAGWGATIGVALGIAAKLAFGIAMVGVFLGVRFL
ncbi:MAG: DUF456 domain-containing protein [Oleiphilaceae bacterium]|nr:DUF456 domain-containing protein [Oleiphilaceae bacterium]